MTRVSPLEASVKHDALVVGVAVLFGVGLTAAGTYAFLHWLFGDLRP